MLGPLTLRLDARPVEVPGKRSQTVLVHLLQARSRTVPDERLIDALYPDRPVPSARNQVQQAVCALRRLQVPVTRVDGAYVLSVADEDVDAFAFERRLRDGLSAAEAGRPGEAVALLREGLDLWRGEPLAGLDGPQFAVLRTNLQELRIAALAGRVDAELALGRHTEVIGRLRDLVAEHPLHERFHAQLMLALYRDGRQAEAMEAFARLRRVLVEEVGTDPSFEVRELHRQVLAQDPALHGPGRAPAVPQQLPPREAPLALEIISMRLRSRPEPLGRIAERLADRDRILTELDLGDLSVRAVLDGGYRALDVRLRTLLRRLGVHGAREVTAELAAALADIPVTRAGYLLDDLVDAELLRACADRDEPVYHCDDMVLAYGHQRALLEDSTRSRTAALERGLRVSRPRASARTP